MNYIYGIWCPVAKAIRYIGKSIRPQDRFISHINVARSGRATHHTGRWIRKLLNSGLMPELRILEEIPDGRSWKVAERRWIAKGRAKGWPLTNSTDGGDSFTPLSKATRLAMAPNIAAAIRKVWLDPEQRKRYVAAFNTPAAKRRKSKAMREALAKPEVRKAISAALSAIWATPERKAFASARSERMHANPEQKARLLASIRRAAKRPDAKAKLATAMAEVNARPEVIAKRSAHAKRIWAKPGFRENIFSEVARAKLSKSIANYWKQNP